MNVRRDVLFGVVLLGACSTDDRSSTAQSGGVVTGTAAGTGESTGSHESSETGAATSTDDDSEHTPKFDLGQPESDLGSMAKGCRNIDFLFVIDNSASMDEEQAALVSAFPGFVEGVRETAQTAKSLHIGVVTTDRGPNPSPCRTQGALLVRGGSGSSCPDFVEGGAFLTEADPLEHHFACIAEVGTHGSDEETPLRSMDLALSPEMNAPGGCNAGFVRDDGLWVVTFITDENDRSEGTVDEYVERMIDRRGGNEASVVVLALVRTPHDQRVTAFTEAWTHGFVGDIATTDYAEFFASSLAGIADACAAIDPAG